MPRAVWICALSVFPLLISEGLPAQQREFDALSFKHTGDVINSHFTREMRDGHEVRVVHWKPPEFVGNRFSADAQLPIIIDFAFHPLVTPYRQEVPD